VPSSSNRQIAEDTILVFRANDRQERTLLFVLSGVAPRPAAKRKRGRGRRPSPSSYLISWMPRIPTCFGSPKANSDNVGSGSRRGCEAEGPALAALDRKPEVRQLPSGGPMALGQPIALCTYGCAPPGMSLSVPEFIRPGWTGDETVGRSDRADFTGCAEPSTRRPPTLRCRSWFNVRAGPLWPEGGRGRSAWAARRAGDRSGWGVAGCPGSSRSSRRSLPAVAGNFPEAAATSEHSRTSSTGRAAAVRSHTPA
jgi:hypothetical protein